MMGRDMVGSFKTADEIERQLNRWLQALCQHQPRQHGRDRGRAFRWSRAMSRCASARESRACSAARSTCSRTISSTTSPPPSSSSPISRHPASVYAGGSMSPSSAERTGEAGRLFRAGKLDDALTAAKAAVRKAPTDHRRARPAGRAAGLRRQPRTRRRRPRRLPRPSIRRPRWWWRSSASCCAARLARRQLFRDGRVPEFLGEPTDAQRLSLAAMVALRNGDTQEAGKRAGRGRGGARPPAPAPPAARRSTTCATPTTCWPAASRSSPRPASISGSRPSG